MKDTFIKFNKQEKKQNIFERLKNILASEYDDFINKIKSYSPLKIAYKHWLNDGALTFESLVILKSNLDNEMSNIIQADQLIQPYMERFSEEIVDKKYANKIVIKDNKLVIMGRILNRDTKIDDILSTHDLNKISKDPLYWKSILSIYLNYSNTDYNNKNEFFIPFEGFSDDKELEKTLNDRIVTFEPKILDLLGKKRDFKTKLNL
jgi:hypothetical protein